MLSLSKSAHQEFVTSSSTHVHQLNKSLLPEWGEKTFGFSKLDPIINMSIITNNTIWAGSIGGFGSNANCVKLVQVHTIVQILWSGSLWIESDFFFFQKFEDEEATA